MVQNNGQLAQNYDHLLLQNGQTEYGQLDFITPTTMKLFSLFMDNPLGQYHEREEVQQSHVSKGSANKILRLLSNIELLTVQSRGNMKIYRLNFANPSVVQFKIFKNVFTLRRLVNSLKRYARKVVLFGSFAEGRNVPESDIDLFIVSLDGKKIAKRIVSEYNSEERRRIAAVIVDAIEFARMKRHERPFYENIEKGIE